MNFVLKESLKIIIRLLIRIHWEQVKASSFDPAQPYTSGRPEDVPVIADAHIVLERFNAPELRG